MVNESDDVFELREEFVVTPSKLASDRRKEKLLDLERENKRLGDVFRSLEFEMKNKFTS